MSKYKIGTKIAVFTQEYDAYGEIINAEELRKLEPDIVILDEDICVKWVNKKGEVDVATTVSEEWLNQNSIIGGAK